MCKIQLWSAEYILKQTTPNFGLILNLIEISLVGQGPGVPILIWWNHDDVMVWKGFPHYCLFMRGINWSPMDGLLKGPVMQTVEQTVMLLVIWDALMWHLYNALVQETDSAALLPSCLPNFKAIYECLFFLNFCAVGLVIMWSNHAHSKILYTTIMMKVDRRSEFELKSSHILPPQLRYGCLLWVQG